MNVEEEAVPEKPVYGVCLGAQKAGTTWLHRYFTRHPQAHVPLVKEMHYFDALSGPERTGSVRRRKRRLRTRERRERFPQKIVRYVRRKMNCRLRYPSVEYSRAMVSMYRDAAGSHKRYFDLLTDGMSKERCVLDITPSYSLIGEDGLREILRFRSDTRFVFILRDPVARTWSSLRFHIATQSVPRGAKPKRLYEIAAEFLAGGHENIWRRSDYAATVRALDVVVPDAQVFFMFYETMFRQSEIRRLNKFLGLDDFPAETASAVNAGPSAEMTPELELALRRKLAPVYEAMLTRFGTSLPKEWRLGSNSLDCLHSDPESELISNP